MKDIVIENTKVLLKDEDSIVNEKSEVPLYKSYVNMILQFYC